MGAIRLMVLDVLKPHTPSLIELVTVLSDLKGVDGADAAIIEMDKDVETVKITIAGNDIQYDMVKKVIENMAASIHSIDKVSAGSKLVEEASTPQDKK